MVNDNKALFIVPARLPLACIPRRFSPSHDLLLGPHFCSHLTPWDIRFPSTVPLPLHRGTSCLCIKLASNRTTSLFDAHEQFTALPPASTRGDQPARALVILNRPKSRSYGRTPSAASLEKSMSFPFKRLTCPPTFIFQNWQGGLEAVADVKIWYKGRGAVCKKQTRGNCTQAQEQSVYGRGARALNRRVM